MNNPCVRVVLGVTGGIAAYKAADLVRRLRERSFDVRVVMTPAACHFVTPLTFQALSGHPVHRDLFDEDAEAAMGHIELARWADRVLVAPATADFIAKLRAGRAGDLLSTLCLATSAPIVIAPAMNQQMWMNRATADNVNVLLERGVRMIGPTDGDQACGEVGGGRMSEPTEIAEYMTWLCGRGGLENLSVLVTAGPTQESIDPVRYISNHSSGKMGYAVAQAAAEAGARVTLVSGPTSLATPCGVRKEAVVSAAQMYERVMANIAESDIFIGAAAVADYAPEFTREKKIKKHSGDLAISMRSTTDILAEVANLQDRPFTVGFAAETDRLEHYARDKLKRKSLDLIAANEVGKPGTGFAGDTNELHLYWEGGTRVLALGPKTRIARDLIEVVAERYHAQHPA